MRRLVRSLAGHHQVLLKIDKGCTIETSPADVTSDVWSDVFSRLSILQCGLNSLVWPVSPRFFSPLLPQYFLPPGILVHFREVTATPDD